MSRRPKLVALAATLEQMAADLRPVRQELARRRNREWPNGLTGLRLFLVVDDVEDAIAALERAHKVLSALIGPERKRGSLLSTEKTRALPAQTHGFPTAGHNTSCKSPLSDARSLAEGGPDDPWKSRLDEQAGE